MLLDRRPSIAVPVGASGVTRVRKCFNACGEHSVVRDTGPSGPLLPGRVSTTETNSFSQYRRRTL